MNNLKKKRDDFSFRDSLAFATESCFCSLANCLGFYDNITQPILKEFEDYKLYDVEIRYGIVQV
jgi:SCY1-like protein 2